MGKKPDRSLVRDIFGAGDVVYSSRMKTASKRPTPPNPSKPKSSQDRFMEKLRAEDFHEFDHKDWLSYFKYKFETANGTRYFIGNYAKEYAIIKSLMRELHWDEIKRMIDFIFDSDQDIYDKRTAGTFLLSRGWVNTIYHNSRLWSEGSYQSRSAKKNPPKRTREWQGESVVASRKDAGTGISYGKPVRDKDDDDDKPKGKRRVYL